MAAATIRPGVGNNAKPEPDNEATEDHKDDVGREGECGKDEQPEQAERHGEEGRPEVVDPVFAMLDGFVEGAQQHPGRQDAQGHVDVEDPAPAEELGEEAAEGGPTTAEMAQTLAR